MVLKRVVRRTADDNRFLIQAENEYDISRQFQSPYLRRSFDLRRVRRLLKVKELHVFMEYFDGRTLEDVGPLGTSGLLRIFMKVAQGLEALHQMEYIHADLKPNNILLDSNGNVKIIDFGQSCRIGHIKGRIQGTPGYIAPEQTERGVPLDKTTDVYNFGATLYWAITGRPYPTVMPQKKRAVGIDLAGPREAPLPHDLNPNVPIALSRLVMDCCKDNPKERPPDLSEVLHRLRVTQDLLDRNDASLTGPVVRKPKNAENKVTLPGAAAPDRYVAEVPAPPET
jgi:serine/threonine-protein kinase